MSEKEQAEALKLLHQWLRADALTPAERVALRARTEKLLELPIIPREPEAHGHRRG